MRWIEWLSNKIIAMYQANTYKEQRLFVADTILMTRFWIALLLSLILMYEVSVYFGIDYVSWMMFPIGVVCFAIVFIILDKLLDWFFPIS